AGDVTVGGSVEIGASGALNAYTYGITLGGDWTNAGAFDAGTGAVTFKAIDSQNHTILTNADADNNHFNDLAFSSGDYTLQGDLYVDGDILFDSEDLLAITVDPSNVTESLDGFPMLFSIEDTALQNKLGDVGGYTFKFMADNAELPYEVEECDDASGKLIAWIKVDLSDVDPTTVYFYYNLPAAPAYTPAAVWDANYKGVWHLDETSGTVFDSTSNGNDSTAVSGVTMDATGQINGADQFDGDNDYITRSYDDDFDFGSGSFTADVWVKRTVATNDGYIIDRRRTGDSAGFRLRAYTINDVQFTVKDTSGGEGVIQYSAGGAPDESSPFPLDEWVYVTAVKNGTSDIKLYLNGSFVAEDTSIGSGSLSVNGNLRIGAPRDLNASYSWGGIIDEVRISDTARSDGWIATSYSNQENPSSFYSQGPGSKLSAGAHDIHVAGDWTNSSDFDAGSGKVTLTGDPFSVSKISGDTVFNDLECRVDDKVIEFEPGSTQTVDGIITLEGTSSHRIILRAIGDASASWNIDMPDVGARNLSFLDVKYSTNTDDIPVAAQSLDFVDSGDNVNWLFTTADDYTWIGLGTDYDWWNADNWQTAIPGDGNTATAIFTSVATKNCTIDLPVTVGGINILSGYNTGTITQEASLTITGGNFTQAGGTFDGADQSLNIDNGSVTITGGEFIVPTTSMTVEKDFTLGAGGTLTNNGAITFDSSVLGRPTTITGDLS
ncbi:LamG domain-containing protein, partial [Candidatus Omnitrophota bacterium]